jgi:hypothetical protein
MSDLKPDGTPDPVSNVTSGLMADRRSSPRYPLVVLANVTLAESGVSLNARTSDVSRGGCYIDTLQPLEKGSNVLVRLTQKGEIFEARGTIVYVSPGLGMGVQFHEPVPALQLAILDRWLASLAAASP